MCVKDNWWLSGGCGRRAGAKIKNRKQRLPSAGKVSVVLERRSDDVARLSKALSGEPQDRGTIDKAVDGCNRGGLRWKEISPLAEAGVGGEDDGALLMSG